MISDDKIIEIFCSFDDFTKEFNSILDKNSICDGSPTKKRNRKSGLPIKFGTIFMLLFDC